MNRKCSASRKMYLEVWLCQWSKLRIDGCVDMDITYYRNCFESFHFDNGFACFWNNFHFLKIERHAPFTIPFSREKKSVHKSKWIVMDLTIHYWHRNKKRKKNGRTMQMYHRIEFNLCNFVSNMWCCTDRSKHHLPMCSLQWWMWTGLAYKSNSIFNSRLENGWTSVISNENSIIKPHICK